MLIKSLTTFLLFFLLSSFSNDLVGTSDRKTNISIPEKKDLLDDRFAQMEALILSVYDNIIPGALTKPSYEVFKKGMIGYYNLKEKGHAIKENFITVIDFTLPSNEKRLWVIDLDEQKVVFNELVAHGRNTGNVKAEKFSNIPESHMSSQGFYLTGKTYYGQHGLSLRLQGMEAQINDKAFERAIVIHGADYVSEEFIKKYGRLGRSYGCPSVSKEVSNDLIELIKDNSCLFIYSPALDYDKTSSFLNASVASEYLSTNNFLR